MARTKYLKNTRLQQTLDNYAKDLNELVTIKPISFDIPTVATMVRQTPQRKWNAAQAIVNATIEKKQCESHVKRLRAMKMLEASHHTKKGRLSNADDRKAFVDADEKVIAAEIDLINADATLTAARMGYDCLTDLYEAGKKIMNWLIEEDKATRDYNRFVDEGKRHA
jgi:hypothetical protein